MKRICTHIKPDALLLARDRFGGKMNSRRTKSGGLPVAALVLGVTLQASAAFGQSCTAFVNQMISEGRLGNSLVFEMVSSQANRLSTVVTGWAFWDGTAMDTNNVNVTQRFSDRYRQVSASGTNPAFTQNLDPFFTSREYLHLRFSAGAGGDLSLSVQNTTWGYQISFQSLSCSDGVIYGFGTPIGNANAGRPAMYVFRYYFDFYGIG